jgi:peptide/nickel transport system substrate-binding protein
MGRRLAVLAVAAQLAAACSATPTEEHSLSPAPPATATSTSAALRGGTLRVVVPRERAPSASHIRADPPVPSALDPQKEFTIDGLSILRCCLTRTLLGHNGRDSEHGGSRLHPDVAAALPEIGPDGRTWTIRLRKGLHYGPPLQDVEITAADFVRGLHRLLAPDIFDFGMIYFGDIEGAEAYHGSDAASISGLEVPDDHTLVVRLTAPNGNLAARLAMPLVSPIPPSPADPSAPFGVAQGHDDGYGSFLVSSGPYMLEGSEHLDFSRGPADQVPVSGIAPGQTITLVRNPSWDPATDELRTAYADRIAFAIVPTIDEALRTFDAGAADVVWNPSLAPVYTPEEIGPYLTGQRPASVVIDDHDASRGIFLNVALPPFDDVHVRRAANYAVDKARLVELTGGPAAARTAGHLVTDSVLDNLLIDYDPYATPGSRGDIAKAQEEMRLSAHDNDGDGRCDGAPCSAIRAVTRGGPYELIGDAVRDDLAPLGLDVAVDNLDPDGFFESYYDPQARVSMLIGLALTKSFMSASSFFIEQFDGRVSVSPRVTNGTLVGASPELLEAWGYEPRELPSIDDRIDACLPLVGAAQFECWAALDQYVMENVVPVVPYAFDNYPSIMSARVVSYDYDQLWASPAWDRIALGD